MRRPKCFGHMRDTPIDKCIAMGEGGYVPCPHMSKCIDEQHNRWRAMDKLVEKLGGAKSKWQY